MTTDKLQTFDLTVIDRIALQGVLKAQRGDEIEARVIEKFITDLSLTEDELVEYGVVGNVMAIDKIKHTKPFTFTSWRLKKIRGALTEIHNNKAVGQEVVGLFKIFFDKPISTTIDPELAEEYAALNIHKEADDVVNKAMSE